MLPDKLPPLPRRARVLLLAAVGLIALLLVGPRLVDAYANWLWFGEVGFRSVWVTVLLDKYLFYRPTYRLLADLRNYDLDLSLGTVTEPMKRRPPISAADCAAAGNALAMMMPKAARRRARRKGRAKARLPN